MIKIMCLDVRDKFVALKEKRIIVRGEYSNTNVTRRFKKKICKLKLHNKVKNFA